jgi:hypothetical protein
VGEARLEVENLRQLAFEQAQITKIGLLDRHGGKQVQRRWDNGWIGIE